MPSFVVPALPKVIPQDRNTAGWFAAACLLATWRRRRLLSANDNRAAEALEHRADASLPPDAVRRLAGAMGLVPVPAPQALPGPALLEQWLRRYGPLWTDAVGVDAHGVLAERGHVVVIGGVDPNPSAPRFYVLDPCPDERGHEGWRPYGQLHALLAFRAERRAPVAFLTHP